MSKLDELIQQLCPDGVEWKTLGEIAINRDRMRKPITASKRVAGVYPYYGASGIVDYVDGYIFDGNYLLISEDGANLIARSTPIAFPISGKTWVNNHAHVLEFDSLITQRLVEIYLNSIDLSKYISGGAQPKLNQDNLNSILIPIPPLPIQEEIVRLLDQLTESTQKYQAKLEAELDARKKQYEHYRNQLLSFDASRTDVEWKALNDIGDFFGGLTGKSKNDFIDGNATFITYSNIYSNPSLNLNIDEKVRIDDGEKQNVIQYGDILFTGSSETPEECGMSSVVTKEPTEKMYLNSFCFGLRLFELDKFNFDYLKHLFRSTEIRKEICKTANGVTRFNVSKKKMGEIAIPLPPLAEQERIVDILDRMDKAHKELCQSIETEIKMRKQQYEYYRNQLLDFKKKED